MGGQDRVESNLNVIFILNNKDHDPTIWGTQDDPTDYHNIMNSNFSFVIYLLKKKERVDIV